LKNETSLDSVEGNPVNTFGVIKYA